MNTARGLGDNETEEVADLDRPGCSPPAMQCPACHRSGRCHHAQNLRREQRPHRECPSQVAQSAPNRGLPLLVTLLFTRPKVATARNATRMPF